MTLAMDVRIAAQNAKLGFVFTRRGIVPEACSSWFLPRIVGISQALEWILSGRIFSVDEAVKSGLVKSSHAPANLLPAAQVIAKEIADNTSAVSVALARQMLWRMLGAAHPMEAHKVDSRAIYYSGKSADASEGITSFLEKRPAKFTDKPSTDMPAFYPWWEERTFDE
jgi:enoyl-CoA hydratase/carnithine racemase